MLVLGLNLFHSDASAAILHDGDVIFAIAEERLNRIKHFGGIPVRAIRACLEAVNAQLSDVDHVALGRKPGSHMQQKLRWGLSHPSKLRNLVALQNRGKQSFRDLRSLLSAELEVDPGSLRFEQHFIEHHLAHIASAFYPSGLSAAAGLSNDGSGDFVSMMTADCEDTRIEVRDRVFLPHSLGNFYTMMCEFIGYKKYGDEGKVMGLAALGDASLVDGVADIVKWNGQTFKLNLDYFMPVGSDQGFEILPSGEVRPTRQYGDKMIRRFGRPREPGDELTERDMNLAFAMQQRFEDVLFNAMRSLHADVSRRDVVMAGGCALNSVANGKIFDETPFERTWIQPAAGDEGLSLGAALYCWHSILGRPRAYEMTDAYLGPQFSDDEIRRELDAAGLSYRRLEREQLLEQVAEAIADGKVVGWFQGRMEWGPRALGNRSILAHPGLPHMKDTLNARIKHREWFRPFAPSIHAERLTEYFEHDHPSPFMLHVYKVRPGKREELRAVNHVDDTGRLQTVTRAENPLYYDLIEAFRRRTGTPVVLNTSFNENEPIVCNPGEAVACFERTHMDVLAIGSFLVSKQDAALQTGSGVTLERETAAT